MGTGVVLLAIGAILRYAINDDIQNVDVQMVGLILMIAGAVTFLVGAIYAATARRRAAAVVVERDPRYPDEPRY